MNIADGYGGGIGQTGFTGSHPAESRARVQRYSDLGTSVGFENQLPRVGINLGYRAQDASGVGIFTRFLGIQPPGAYAECNTNYLYGLQNT